VRVGDGQTYGEGGRKGHLVLGVGGEQGRVQQLAVLKHLAHPAQMPGFGSTS
jgi:hypothetical protein